MTNPNDLDTIRRGTATPLPWHYESNEIVSQQKELVSWGIGNQAWLPMQANKPEDREYMMAAANVAQALLARAEKAEEERKEGKP